MLARLTLILRSPALLTLVGRGIQYVSQLAMVLIVPKALTAAAYVELNLVLPLAALGASLIFGWLTNAIYRHVFELLGEAGESFRRTVFFYFGVISLLLLLTFIVVNEYSESIYRMVPLLLIATAMKTAVLGVFNASSKHVGFLLANIGFALSLATFILLCFFGGGERIDMYVAVYSVIDIAVAFVGWVALRVIQIRSFPRFDVKLAKRYFAYGLPLVVNVMAVWVISLSDRYLLAIWEPTASVAGYILSYQLGGSVITIPMLFAMAVIFPAVLRIEKESGIDAALAYTYAALGKYRRNIALIFLIACGVVLPFQYFVYQEYEFSPATLIIIVLAHVIYGLSHFYNKEFELNGRTMVITKGVSIGAAANVLTNIALIPLVGGLGAAIATLVAYSISVYWVYRAREYKRVV